MASVLHRMMLIGHARSSHFIERHNIGITKLNTAISAPNVVLKPSENQETANVIHLTSSNFVKNITEIIYTESIPGNIYGNS